MLRLLWSTRAEANLEAILDYIGADNKDAAQRLKARIDALIVPTLTHPHIYRPGRVSGTREIVAHPNYIVVYKVAADHIEISAVLHTRRSYP
jgi:toxin ParE1/3/4